MDEIKEDIRAIRASQSKTEIDIAVIKTDINHHIKRTDLAEARITRAENWSMGIFSAIAIAIIAGVIKMLIG